MMNDFGMFSRAGNNAVKRMVEIAVELPLKTTDAELASFLRGKMEIIARKHGEVYDTVVREEIIAEVGRHRSSVRELSIFDITRRKS